MNTRVQTSPTPQHEKGAIQTKSEEKNMKKKSFFFFFHYVTSNNITLFTTSDSESWVQQKLMLSVKTPKLYVN